jgi:hypothetical protein
LKLVKCHRCWKEFPNWSSLIGHKSEGCDVKAPEAPESETGFFETDTTRRLADVLLRENR